MIQKKGNIQTKSVSSVDERKKERERERERKETECK